MNCGWDLSLSLDPLGLYLNIITVVSALSLQAWTSVADLSKLMIFSIPPRNLYIYLLPSDDRDQQLQPAHLILAMRKIVFEMALKTPGFFSVRATLSLDGRKLGSIWLTTKPPAPLPTNFPTSRINAFLPIQSTQVVEAGLPSGTINNLTATSGEIDNKKDPSFKIAWLVADDALAIPGQEIFTAVLDAQTVAASHARLARCDWITGVSVGGKAVFAFTRKPGQTISYVRISKALLLITMFPIVDKKLFREMSFELKIEGVVVATGVLYRVRLVGDAGETGELSSS